MIPEVLLRLIEDSEVTDIFINAHDEIYFEGKSGIKKLESPYPFQDEQHLKRFALDHLSAQGKTWDAKYPFVDALFFGTHRAHITLPPAISKGTVISLRRLNFKPSHLMHSTSDLAERWNLKPAYAQQLIEWVQGRKNILIAGSTGAGKTSLLNDLLCFSEKTDRIITLEETPEITVIQGHHIALFSKPTNADGVGGLKFSDLVKQSLRMKPDRLIIGECRGDEVLSLLQALNTGHSGSLCTVHANSSSDAIRRLELLAALGMNGAPLSNETLKDLIAFGIHCVIHVKKTIQPEQGSKRIITSLLSLEGRERGVILRREHLNP